MIIVGLVLIVAVVVGGIIVVDTAGDSVHLDVHWFTIRADGTALFLAGAAALLLLMIGAWFLRRGLRRARNRRREMRELRNRAAAEPRVAPSRPAPRAGTNADDHFDTAPRE